MTTVIIPFALVVGVEDGRCVIEVFEAAQQVLEQKDVRYFGGKELCSAESGDI